MLHQIADFGQERLFWNWWSCVLALGPQSGVGGFAVWGLGLRQIVWIYICRIRVQALDIVLRRLIAWLPRKFERAGHVTHIIIGTNRRSCIQAFQILQPAQLARIPTPKVLNEVVQVDKALPLLFLLVINILSLFHFFIFLFPMSQSPSIAIPCSWPFFDGLIPVRRQGSRTLRVFFLKLYLFFQAHVFAYLNIWLQIVKIGEIIPTSTVT